MAGLHRLYNVNLHFAFAHCIHWKLTAVQSGQPLNFHSINFLFLLRAELGGSIAGPVLFRLVFRIGQIPAEHIR